MRTMQKVLLPFFLLTLSINSSARIYLEPLVGSNLSGNQKFTNLGEKISYNHAGFFFGGKLGYAITPGFIIGGDYRSGKFKPTLKGTAAGFPTKPEYDTTSIGAFISANIVPLFNVFAAYYFKNEQQRTNDNSSELYSGNRTSLGVGFTGLPFVSINLEYSIFEFDSHKEGGVVRKLPFLGLSTLKGSELLLSISAPINIPL